MEDLLKKLPHEVCLLSAGHFLFRHANPVTSLSLLIRGSIALQHVLSDGTVTTVRVCRPGMLVDEASLFSPNYACDALATSPCELIRVSRQAAWQELQAISPFALGMLRSMARSLQESQENIELRGMRPLSARLLAWMELQTQDAEGWITLDCAWTEIARMLAMSQEALYRTLSALVTAGCIEKHQRRVRVLLNEVPVDVAVVADDKDTTPSGAVQG